MRVLGLSAGICGDSPPPACGSERQWAACVRLADACLRQALCMGLQGQAPAGSLEVWMTNWLGDFVGIVEVCAGLVRNGEHACAGF